MKSLSFVCFLLLANPCLFAQTTTQDFGLPELHTIKTVTLNPPYSCRSPEQFQKGYETTALFLSKYSKQLNVPDLLFNGACRAGNYFQAGAGWFSLIADLGPEVTLEEVSVSRALKRIHGFIEYSKFVAAVKVEPKHTYAVLLNERDISGLFIFKVDEYMPDEKVVLRYAVKSYQIRNGSVQAQGFDWVKRSN
jgi:hypothetical protein